LRDGFVRRFSGYSDNAKEEGIEDTKEYSSKEVTGADDCGYKASYEPSHIMNVLDSEYWQWRRYKAYYRYVYGEEGMEERYREVREFMKE
jgi:hypothetical protein